MCMKLLQSCPTLCDPVDRSPPGSSVHGILQASILEGVVISSSRGSSRPRDQTQVSYISCTGRWVLYHCTIWEAQNPYGQLKFILIGVTVCFRNVKCISRNLNVFRLNTLVRGGVKMAEE